MISGPTIKKTKMEIRSTLKFCPFVQSAWGFGSFFRGSEFKDIDIVVVLRCPRGQILEYSKIVRYDMRAVGGSLGRQIDVLILTSSEFAERPLREADRLVLLYQCPPIAESRKLPAP
jgi:predicted nucleotidyltransferase